MRRNKYKYDNQLWLLEKETGKSITSITYDKDGNTKKIKSLCYSCHGEVFEDDKKSMRFCVEHKNIVKENGDKRYIPVYIYICGDCCSS
jgi:hypothetical protein